MKRSKKGFTLVELIVVITILGILAGVGTVAYSGYIKKANQAADEILLGAINQAYSAACIENSRRPTSFGGLNILRVSDDGAIGNLNTSDTGLNASFTELFTNPNVGAVLKYFNGLNLKNGRFEGVEGKIQTLTFTNAAGNVVTVYYSEEDVSAVKDSTFGDPDTVTMEQLMTDVNSVTTLAQTMLSGATGGLADMVEAVAADPAFASFVSSLGKDVATLTDAEKVNALVMFAATNTNKMDATTLYSNLKSATANGQTLNASQFLALASASSPEEGIANAAALYGMVVAYAHQNSISTNDPISAIMTVIGDSDFGDYVANSGEADLAGYVGSMNLLADNIGNIGSDTILANGFTDPDIIALLNQVFNQGNP